MDNSHVPHWTDDVDLLDRYVLELVDQPELAILERHLRLCEHCQLVVQDERELLAGIKLSGREKMKELLRESLKSEEANIFQRYQFISLAAAVLVILVGLGVFRYYVGSIEWPLKFSSRTYIVKQGARDSSAASEKKEELSASQADKPVAHESRQDQTRQAENPAAGNANNSNTGTFWLLGKVIVIPEPNGEEHLAARTEAGGVQEEGVQKSSSGGSRKFTIQRNGTKHYITVRQRSSDFLPKSHFEKGIDSRAVETLVERTPQGLHLTLFRDTLFRDSQFEHASIEPVTEDSLIVNVANERIAYRIPGGWSAHQSAKTNIERR